MIRRGRWRALGGAKAARFVVSMTSEMAAWLTEEAERQNVERAEVIRRAVKWYRRAMQEKTIG